MLQIFENNITIQIIVPIMDRINKIIGAVKVTPPFLRNFFVYSDAFEFVIVPFNTLIFCLQVLR